MRTATLEVTYRKPSTVHVHTQDKAKTPSVSIYLYSLTTETLFLIETTEYVSLCIHLMHFFYFKNDTSTNIFMSNMSKFRDSYKAKIIP